MDDVVIVAGCRTPIGRFGGAFRNLSAVELTIPVMRELVGRTGIDPAIINDIIWGCNYQKTNGENNLARVASVRAGIPVSVPGVTVHRNSTSSMTSVQMAYYQIKSGEADVIMAGGTDSMSNAQYTVEKMRFGKNIGHMRLRDSLWDSLTNSGIGPSMGLTAENLAEMYSISREEQDKLALLSHERAVNAIDTGCFKEEIVPVQVKLRMENVIIDTDEFPRRDSSLAALSKLMPIFKVDGTVTAGNSSGINDGAAGVLLMSEQKAEELCLPVLAKIISTATAGVDPDIMGVGSTPAGEMALMKAGLELENISLVEINEAFAAQYLVCEKIMGLNRDTTNVNGSGISLGHPVGATGVRIIISLMYEMKRRNAEYGLAALCAGGGMGTSVIIKRYIRGE